MKVNFAIRFSSNVASPKDAFTNSTKRSDFFSHYKPSFNLKYFVFIKLNRSPYQPPLHNMYKLNCVIYSSTYCICRLFSRYFIQRFLPVHKLKHDGNSESNNLYSIRLQKILLLFFLNFNTIKQYRW